MRLLDWFEGVAVVRFAARERRVYTAQMMRGGIRAVGGRNLCDGGLELALRMRDLRRLRALSAERGLAMPGACSVRGLPVLQKRIRMRPGLLIGGVLSAVLLVLLTTVVWRVDVICLDNAQGTAARDRVDIASVKGALAAEGIGIGMFLPGFDARAAENRYLLAHNEISWMAINRVGTVLSVEVRPAHTVSRDGETALLAEDGYLRGSHLVADADGRILSFSVRGGQMTVVPEQMVLRGQLLASGIYTSETGDAVAGRAHGEVLAETVRVLRADIPITETVIRPDGSVRTEGTFVLFGHDILTVSWPPCLPEQIVTFLETFQKNGEKSGIDRHGCGIITDEAISDAAELPLCLPGGLPLPVSVRVQNYLGIQTTERALTEEEALLRARTALDRQEAALGAKQMISREETVLKQDGVLTAERYVFCVDNIAVPEEYRIKPE